GVLPTASITDDRRFERTSLIFDSTDLQSAAELRKGSPRSRADVARGREAEGGGVRERRRRLGGPHRHAADSCAREVRAFHVGSVGAAHARREAPDALLPARTDFCEPLLPAEALRNAHAPPAIAGTMLTSSPPFRAVPRPSRKRMSSSPT